MRDAICFLLVSFLRAECARMPGNQNGNDLDLSHRAVLLYADATEGAEENAMPRKLASIGCCGELIR